MDFIGFLVLFILPIICIVLTYLYYQYDLKKDIKIIWQILLVLLCFGLNLIILFLPYTVYLLSRELSVFIIILVFYLTLAIGLGTSNRSRKGPIIYQFWLKMFLIIYYIPIIIIKTFRHFPIGIIITISVFTILVSFGILYLFIYLEKSKKWKVRNGIIILSAFVFFVLVTGNVSILSSIRVFDDQKTLINLGLEMDDDYTSTRIAENTVMNNFTYLLDFAYYDEMLFFATNSMSFTQYYGSRIYVVDTKTNEVVDEVTLSNSLSFHKVDFMIYENQLYCASSEGIYKWNGTTFVLFQELETSLNTFLLLENGGLACIGVYDRRDYLIYQSTESGFDLIDELDYRLQDDNTGFLVIENELFVMDELDMTVLRYNKNQYYDFDMPDVTYEIPIGLIDDKLILRGYEKDTLYSVEPKEGIEPSRYSLIEEVDITSSFSQFQDLVYQSHSIGQIKSSYLYDKTLMQKFVFYPTYTNQKYVRNEKEIMMIGDIDSSLYYLLLTEEKGFTRFTFSRLDYDQKQINGELFNNINIDSALLVFVVLITPMIVPNKWKSKQNS